MCQWTLLISTLEEWNLLAHQLERKKYIHTARRPTIRLKHIAARLSPAMLLRNISKSHRTDNPTIVVLNSWTGSCLITVLSQSQRTDDKHLHISHQSSHSLSVRKWGALWLHQWLQMHTWVEGPTPKINGFLAIIHSSIHLRKGA